MSVFGNLGPGGQVPFPEKASPNFGNFLTDLTGLGETQYNRYFDQVQMFRDDNKLTRMVADARRAGVSPIAAMGAAGSYGQVGSSAQNKGGLSAGALAQLAQQAYVNKAVVNKTNAEARLIQARTATEAAQRASLFASAAASRGGEERAGDLHSVVRRGMELANSSSEEQLRFVRETFNDRVARVSVDLDRAEVNRIIDRQRSVLAHYDVNVAYYRNLELRMYNAWRADPSSTFTFPLSSPTTFEGFRNEDRGETVTVDLSSFRYRHQFELAANQIALETAGFGRDITRKKKMWFEAMTLAQMITGAAGATVPYIPYMQRQSPTLAPGPARVYGDGF